MHAMPQASAVARVQREMKEYSMIDGRNAEVNRKAGNAKEADCLQGRSVRYKAAVDLIEQLMSGWNEAGEKQNDEFRNSFEQLKKMPGFTPAGEYPPPRKKVTV